VVDHVLAGLGRKREVVAALPYYLAALATVQATELIATVPRSLAERFAASFGLAVTEPPIAIRRFTVKLLRHRRNLGDPLLDWVAEELRSTPAVG